MVPSEFGGSINKNSLDYFHISCLFYKCAAEKIKLNGEMQKKDKKRIILLPKKFFFMHKKLHGDINDFPYNLSILIYIVFFGLPCTFRCCYAKSCNHEIFPGHFIPLYINYSEVFYSINIHLLTAALKPISRGCPLLWIKESWSLSWCTARIGYIAIFFIIH